VRFRDKFIQPPHRMDGEQVVDITGEDMVLKLVAVAWNAVPARVIPRAVQEQVERGEQRALEPARLWIEEAQEDVRLLA